MNTSHDIAWGSDPIGNIASINHSTGAQAVPGFASGAESPSRQYQGDSPHSTTVQTTALAQVLALNTGTILQAGYCVTGSTSTVPFRERAGCVASSPVHQAITTEHLAGYISAINAEQERSATLDLMLRYLSTDGFADPVTPVSGAVLSAADTTVDEYLLAKAFIDGVEVPEFTGVSINPGFEIIEQKNGAGPYPVDIFFKTIAPTIEITTQDLQTVVALLNASVTAAIDIYFAKRKHGAISEDFGNTEHIRISATNGLKQAQSITASRDDGSGAVKVDLALPALPATQVVLTATNGVAIP